MLNKAYVESVRLSGGMPLIIPRMEQPSDIQQIAEMINGLLLSGGADISPEWYGEEPSLHMGRVTPERDWTEIALVRAVMERNKPVLAICRGVQVLNTAMGGSLYQDLKMCPAKIQHTQQAPGHHLSHYVNIQEGTRLHRIAGSERKKVNSFHHQAVKSVALGFRVSATASDGVIEAIESISHPFSVGVQWHPEESILSDGFSSDLFAAFIEVCLRTADTSSRKEELTLAGTERE